MQPLNGELLLHARPLVQRRCDLADQLAVLILSGEIAATTLDQLLLQPVFPVPVRALNGTVLVSHTAVVAGGDHAQVGAELAIAAGVVACVAAVAVAEAGAEAVGAVLGRHTAAHRKGVLQGLGQGDKTLAAVDHLHMAPARIGQAEVEQPVLKRHPGNGDRCALVPPARSGCALGKSRVKSEMPSTPGRCCCRNITS